MNKFICIALAAAFALPASAQDNDSVQRMLQSGRWYCHFPQSTTSFTFFPDNIAELSNFASVQSSVPTWTPAYKQQTVFKEPNTIQIGAIDYSIAGIWPDRLKMISLGAVSFTYDCNHIPPVQPSTAAAAAAEKKAYAFFIGRWVAANNSLGIQSVEFFPKKKCTVVNRVTSGAVKVENTKAEVMYEGKGAQCGDIGVFSKEGSHLTYSTGMGDSDTRLYKFK